MCGIGSDSENNDMRINVNYIIGSISTDNLKFNYNGDSSDTSQS